jgi:hypothetical protein
MDQESRFARFFPWAIVVVLLVFAAYAITIILLTQPTRPLSMSVAGTFGDSFGALTSVFTGLAFAGLLATIVLQREELKLNRRELGETRREFQLQSETFQRQRFEDSFYRLLSLYKDNLRELSVTDPENPTQRVCGIDALRFLLARLTAALKEGKWYKWSSDDNEQLLYLYFLEKTVRGYFGNQRQARYVETLKSILVLIDEECVPETRKPLYWQILVAQLTAYEIKYAFYLALVAADLQAIRDVMVRSQAFKERFATVSFPHGHLAAYERLWGISLPRRQKPLASRLPADQVRAARLELRERRRAERRAARASTPSPDSDSEDCDES